MDGWLKTLVALACVVVIAGGGYYAWSEYSDAKVGKARTARAVAAQTCSARIDDITNGRLSGDDQLVINDCIMQGLITSADLERAADARKRRLGG